MKAPLLDCSRDDFRVAHDVSAYSLVALARGAAPLMARASHGGCADDGGEGTGGGGDGGGGSIVALSYLGAQRVVPQYGVMGAAKASLEAVARHLAVELVRASGAPRDCCRGDRRK